MSRHIEATLVARDIRHLGTGLALLPVVLRTEDIWHEARLAPSGTEDIRYLGTGIALLPVTLRTVDIWGWSLPCFQ